MTIIFKHDVGHGELNENSEESLSTLTANKYIHTCIHIYFFLIKFVTALDKEYVQRKHSAAGKDLDFTKTAKAKTAGVKKGYNNACWLMNCIEKSPKRLGCPPQSWKEK